MELHPTPAEDSPEDPAASPEDGRALVLRAGPQFEFFQAIRLLRGLVGEGRVRIRPDARTVFPPSDIRQIEQIAEGAMVTVTFDGLYGIDAVLPAGLVSEIPIDLAGTRPLRDFLDMFGERYYLALYEAWARYRPGVAVGPGDRPGPDPHAARLLALAGLGAPSTPLPVPAEALLPFAGRLGGWSRSAEGLRVVVEHVLGVSVQVVENVGRWVRMTDRPALGGARLGIDTVVGERVYDASGQFRLVIDALGLDRFLDLLPGRDGARRLAGLVRLAAPDGLAYDVELRLNADEVPPLRLGDAASAQVGRTACLGRPAGGHVARLVRYAD